MHDLMLESSRPATDTLSVTSPAVSNEEAEKKFPKGFKEVKPYLRITPQPNRDA